MIGNQLLDLLTLSGLTEASTLKVVTARMNYDKLTNTVQNHYSEEQVRPIIDVFYELRSKGEALDYKPHTAAESKVIDKVARMSGAHPMLVRTTLYQWYYAHEDFKIYDDPKDKAQPYTGPTVFQSIWQTVNKYPVLTGITSGAVILAAGFGIKQFAERNHGKRRLV